ncbi:MAG: AAA family ATPase, partial [Thiotrichaceae bacterium]|nr:AAA family ATPase [Thiotrichaceae bacterium]
HQSKYLSLNHSPEMKFMTNNALTEITIKNFKCFTDLHLEGFERVNLIGGKNNVGKTAFLEAVELNVSSSKANDLLHTIYQIMRRRQQNIRLIDMELDFITHLDKAVLISSNTNKCSVKYLEEGETPLQNTIFDKFDMDDHEKIESSSIIADPSLEFIVNENHRILPVERIFERRGYISLLSRRENNSLMKTNIISPTTSNEQDIAIFYGALVDLNKESFLNESLQLFDENIISLKQKATEKDIVLKIEIKDRKRPVLLSSLGDGINRFIAILCAIWASQDGFLLIDEIENGIHYTNYPKLWKIIFQASKDANCQLFITTHSKECIQAFNDANISNEGAYFEFYKNLKKNKITAHKRDKQQLDYALSNDRRVRGE